MDQGQLLRLRGCNERVTLEAIWFWFTHDAVSSCIFEPERWAIALPITRRAYLVLPGAVM